MNWYTAFLYTLGSGVVFVIVLALLSLIFMILKGIRSTANWQKRGNIFLLALLFIFGVFLSSFWAGIIVEFAKGIEGISNFWKHSLILFASTPFSYAYVKANTAAVKQVKKGNYIYEIPSIIMNAAAFATIAFIVFWIWPSLNNYLFGNIPAQVFAYLI